jgi:hypothetical protein
MKRKENRIAKDVPPLCGLTSHGDGASDPSELHLVDATDNSCRLDTISKSCYFVLNPVYYSSFNNQYIVLWKYLFTNHQLSCNHESEKFTIHRQFVNR